MRSKKQWQDTIQEQQHSGLAVVDYCKQQKISTSAFYSAKKKLSLPSNYFVRAKITKEVEVIEKRPFITMTVGKVNVSLPSSTSATYLAQLLRECCS